MKGMRALLALVVGPFLPLVVKGHFTILSLEMSFHLDSLVMEA